MIRHFHRREVARTHPTSLFGSCNFIPWSQHAMSHLSTVLLLVVLCVLPCSSRRDSSSVTTLGRFDVSTDRLLSFFGRSTSPTSPSISSSSSSITSRNRKQVFSLIGQHGLDLPSIFTQDSIHAQPAVILKRRTQQQQQPPKDAVEKSSSTASRHELAVQLSQPLIPQDIWEHTTGSEFDDDEEAVELLTKSGLHLCTNPSDDTVEWTPHASTTKLLEDHGHDKEAALKEGNVLVYVGKILKDDVVGAGLPMIKTESILPLPAQDMANLLMDSTKVKIYNKMSLGRTDVKTINPFTKIVRNITKPPVATSSMVSVTLMHTRPLRDDDHLSTGFVVVSRAVPGMVGPDFQDMPRNDILMGVNVLQDRGAADECFMTAVTHVYSPALPKLLAKSMGVTSAVNFVRDIRDSCRE